MAMELINLGSLIRSIYLNQSPRKKKKKKKKRTLKTMIILRKIMNQMEKMVRLRTTPLMKLIKTIMKILMRRSIMMITRIKMETKITQITIQAMEICQAMLKRLTLAKNLQI